MWRIATAVNSELHSALSPFPTWYPDLALDDDGEVEGGTPFPTRELRNVLSRHLDRLNHFGGRYLKNGGCKSFATFGDHPARGVSLHETFTEPKSATRPPYR